MDQLERPPDVSLAVRQHLTVPQVLPYPKLSREWGFLHYPADVSARDFTRILGIDYTLADLNELANDPRSDDQIPDNSDGLVIRLLRYNPADRRMHYLYHLTVATRTAARKMTPDAPYLMAEHLHWTGRDLDEMDAKLGPPSGGLPYLIDVLRSQPEECWTWTIPRDPSRKYPTTASWRGMQHITVHRLLWPIMNPEEPFRARLARVCDNDLCVNPRHFVDPAKRAKRENQGVGRGHTREDGVRAGTTIPYYVENVHPLGEGKFELRCPWCQTPASPYYQTLVNRSIAQGWWGNRFGKMGTFNCKHCSALHRAAKKADVARPRNPKRGLTEAERFDLKFKEQQAVDDWGIGNNWRTSPELMADAAEDEQQALPPGLTPGWPDGYSPD